MLVKMVQQLLLALLTVVVVVVVVAAADKIEQTACRLQVLAAAGAASEAAAEFSFLQVLLLPFVSKVGL